jgi:hypothetical protein
MKGSRILVLPSSDCGFLRCDTMQSCKRISTCGGKTLHPSSWLKCVRWGIILLPWITETVPCPKRFNPYDGGSTVFRNVSAHLLNYTVSLSWEPQSEGIGAKTLHTLSQMKPAPLLFCRYRLRSSISGHVFINQWHLFKIVRRVFEKVTIWVLGPTLRVPLFEGKMFIFVELLNVMGKFLNTRLYDIPAGNITISNIIT